MQHPSDTANLTDLDARTDDELIELFKHYRPRVIQGTITMNLNWNENRHITRRHPETSEQPC